MMDNWKPSKLLQIGMNLEVMREHLVVAQTNVTSDFCKNHIIEARKLLETIYNDIHPLLEKEYGLEDE